MDEPECDCCGSIKVKLKSYSRHVDRKDASEEDKKWMLCEICSHTHISNIVQYNHYGADAKYLAKSMAYCTNAILKELRKDK